MRVRTLAELEPGEQTYVVPWAVRVRADGSAAVDLAHRGHRTPQGTASLLVTRGEGQWVVVPGAQDRWIATDTAPVADGARHQPVLFDMGRTLARRMPDRLHAHTIARMKVGEAGYTVPWAMRWDGSQLVLHPNYTVAVPGKYGGPPMLEGTVQMKVTRTADGFVVDARRLGVMDRHDWPLDAGDPYVGTVYVGTGRHRAPGFPAAVDAIGPGGPDVGVPAAAGLAVSRLLLPDGEVSGAVVAPVRRWGLRRTRTPMLREAVRVAVAREREALAVA